MELILQQVVAANVKAHREARKLSQEGFADLLGKKRQFVTAVETGRQNLTLRTIESVANALGVPPPSLFLSPGSAGATAGSGGPPPAAGGSDQRPGTDDDNPNDRDSPEIEDAGL